MNRKPNEKRTARLEIRISPEEKKLLYILMARTGMTMADIIIESVVDTFNGEMKECGHLSLIKNHVTLRH